MAERRAMQKYYPPDWTPDQGSINKYVGQHPLRERAKKLDQGIMVIRFEMPYNIWCLGCNTHIGRGVRFNAEKKQVGTYFSTKIWSFTMRCPHCTHVLEVQTDPKERDYVLTKGGRRVVETPEETAEERGVIELKTDEEVHKIRSDAFYKLEHDQKDQKKAQDAKIVIGELKKMSDRNHKYDYDLSSQLRKKFREEKKEIEAVEKAKQERVDKGFFIPLADASEEDSVKASRTVFKSQMAEQKMSVRKMQIRASPIFAKSQHKSISTNPNLLALASRMKAAKKRQVDPDVISTSKRPALDVKIIPKTTDSARPSTK